MKKIAELLDEVNEAGLLDDDTTAEQLLLNCVRHVSTDDEYAAFLKAKAKFRWAFTTPFADFLQCSSRWQFANLSAIEILAGRRHVGKDCDQFMQEETLAKPFEARFKAVREQAAWWDHKRTQKGVAA